MYKCVPAVISHFAYSDAWKRAENEWSDEVKVKVIKCIHEADMLYENLIWHNKSIKIIPFIFISYVEHTHRHTRARIRFRPQFSRLRSFSSSFFHLIPQWVRMQWPCSQTKNPNRNHFHVQNDLLKSTWNAKTENQTSDGLRKLREINWIEAYSISTTA